MKHESADRRPPSRFATKRLLALSGIILVIVLLYVLSGHSLTLRSLAEREDQPRRRLESYPLLVDCIAFVG